MVKKLIFGCLIFFHCFPALSQYSTEKPWTFWWWMGSAVNKQDIKFQLENFAKSGLGGAHIIPIYGVKGYENQNLEFLSKDWIEMLDFTVAEANRLGLGIDLTTGTGWPFGGPTIDSVSAAKKFSFENAKLGIELTHQKVKRAAPGGEGYVVDHFNSNSIQKYLVRFDSAFSSLKNKPRAMYCDSYEVYGANWTNDFLAQFQIRNGYNLQSKMDLLIDSTLNIQSQLVKIDYQATLSDLLYNGFAKTWTNWSNHNGFLTRYQAHGSPANLLDLYNLSDIPETESFGNSGFNIPFFRQDEEYEIARFGTPSILAMKFASSPAHLFGKKLVSAETSTWLANHFKVSFSQIKPQIDELFIAGVNHVFYHGTTYSPQSEDPNSPGWLFYASTNYGLRSHLYPHLPLLNQYVKNCQHILQNSAPDHDVLLYFPIADIWSKAAKKTELVQQLGVHDAKWIRELSFGKLAQSMLDNGFGFDYISDAQMLLLEVGIDKKVKINTAKYKTIVVPECKFLPEKTILKLNYLAKNGVKIIYVAHFPAYKTGYHENVKNAEIESNEFDLNARVVPLDDFLTQLKTFGNRQEKISNTGLSFIRKKRNGQVIYFISNLNNLFKAGWIELSTQNQLFEKYNPLTNKNEPLNSKISKGKRLYYLELLPGQSVFLQPTNHVQSKTINKYQKVRLLGDFEINTLKGQPDLNVSTKLAQGVSWTKISDSMSFYSGKVKYRLKFDWPKELLSKNDYMLDLGDVREVAEVNLNGKSIGTAWSLPFQLPFAANLLKQKDNVLEIEVTNLSANFMRIYDKLHPEWKKFYDINIVDIRYKPLTISEWKPMPSGLLSPIEIHVR